MARPVSVLVTYFPTKGKELAFLGVLKRHWPALKNARLVAPGRPQLWKASDKSTGRKYFVEIFAWKDARAPREAHETPEVLAVWEAMEKLLDSMDIGIVKALKLTW